MWRARSSAGQGPSLVDRASPLSITRRRCSSSVTRSFVNMNNNKLDEASLLAGGKGVFAKTSYISIGTKE